MPIPELSRRITIGQYLPTGSVIHRMDARYKLATFVIVVLASAFAPTLAGNVVMLIFSVVLLAISRIPLRYGLSGIRPALWIIVVLFLLEMFFYAGAGHSRVLAHVGPLTVTAGGLSVAVLSVVRFVDIVFLISVLTLSTTLSDLSHAVESLLRPLRVIRFPVHESALILTIALRFVPTFAEEAEKLMKAQASRGADFGTARPWQVWKRTKSMFPILLPLFLSAMHRAEDLVFAMEARGYVPGAQRTSYVELKSSARDLWLLVIALAVSVLVVFAGSL